MVQSLQKVICPFCLIILFIYGCAALLRISLVVESGSTLCLTVDFLLWWPLLFQSIGSRHANLNRCTQAWQLRLKGPRQSTSSIDVAHRFSCFGLCEIFLGQGSNLCPLHQQADSYPLHCQGSSVCPFLNKEISAYYNALQYHT